VNKAECRRRGRLARRLMRLVPGPLWVGNNLEAWTHYQALVERYAILADAA
jgi:hypothetical protein